MIISAYLLIGCLLLLLVALFDKDSSNALKKYQIVITCVCIVLLWPIVLHLITKDLPIKTPEAPK